MFSFLAALPRIILGWILVPLFVLWVLWLVVQVFYWRSNDPMPSPLMRWDYTQANRHGLAVSSDHSWTPLALQPLHAQKALVASAYFYGIPNITEVPRFEPAQSDYWRKKAAEVVAQNLFFSHHRTYLQEAEEWFLVFLITAMWSDERIIEVLLNVAKWQGDYVFGADNAAQYRLKQPLNSLNAEQSARLMRSLFMPGTIEQMMSNNYPTLWQRQQAHIVHLMSQVSLGYDRRPFQGQPQIAINPTNTARTNATNDNKPSHKNQLEESFWNTLGNKLWQFIIP